MDDPKPRALEFNKRFAMAMSGGLLEDHRATAVPGAADSSWLGWIGRANALLEAAFWDGRPIARGASGEQLRSRCRLEDLLAQWRVDGLHGGKAAYLNCLPGFPSNGFAIEGLSLSDISPATLDHHGYIEMILSASSLERAERAVRLHEPCFDELDLIFFKQGPGRLTQAFARFQDRDRIGAACDPRAAPTNEEAHATQRL